MNANGEGVASSEASVIPSAPVQIGTGLSGNQLALFWPIWASNYDAYVTTNLTPPVVWSRVTNQLQSTNGLLYSQIFRTTNSDAHDSSG